jgi:hypothetical protein
MLLGLLTVRQHLLVREDTLPSDGPETGCHGPLFVPFSWGWTQKGRSVLGSGANFGVTSLKIAPEQGL